jgi:redox-sensitive bicupin YhaK (pirin superfamily)
LKIENAGKKIMDKLPKNAELIIEGQEKDLGGFSVRRVLPFNEKRSVGPFVFFDHFGPAELSLENGLKVRPHPHIGLATVTYLFEGCIIHRDSLGFKQSIFPGEVNWMTAGRGVVHSERTPTNPEDFMERMHGLQIWVALPKEFEEVEPDFVNFARETLPGFNIGGTDITLILGEAFGHKSPVPVFSKMFYFDATLTSGGSLPLQFGENEEFAVYITSGEIKVEEKIIGPYQMLVLKTGTNITVTALKDSRLVVIGGEPLSEPRYIWWNFVSSSKERIEKAKLEWINQSMGQVIEETEFIPLPDNGYPVLYP